MSKKQRQIIGYKLLVYFLTQLVGYFQNGKFAKDTEINTISFLLDTKAEKKGFIIDILVFILQKILLLIAPTEVKQTHKETIEQSKKEAQIETLVVLKQQKEKEYVNSK